MNKRRLLPDDRKAEILNAALKLAERPGGWSKLTRDLVAQTAGCADGLVSKYFGTMITFRRTIMRAAIKDNNLSILAQGLASNDPTARKIPPELKVKALHELAGS